MADEVARRALIDGGSEDAVTVNQRALIDKILARYAAEFTVFRELLQNASDSGATHCQLRFETVDEKDRSNPQLPSSTEIASTPSSSSSSSPHASIPDFKAPLKSWVFKNNGRPFSGDDWSRLRRIAEGNPDPDKIGAFGVGFYSLFSVCEEPVVASGEELMGFFWKNGGDSLFTRRAKNPHASEDVSPTGVPWTSFFMKLRETGTFPESPLQLCRFLATSLTFATNLKRLELWFDDHCICTLDKTLEPSKPLSMPSHLSTASPGKMMRVDQLDSQGMQIESQVMAAVWEGERERIKAERERANRPNLASALTKAGGLTSMLQNAFGGRSKDKTSPQTPSASRGIEPAENVAARSARLLQTHSAKAFLKVATSHISVKTDAQYRRELERSTKKPPPTRTTFSIIWVGKEEYDASHNGTVNNDASHDGQSSSITPAQSSLDVSVGPSIVFDGLMPKLGKMGHVFIGFRTHQTTGFAGHAAARFIPTVERESIDFIDRHCAKWNTELLAIGGYTCRAVYENEMSLLQKAWVSTDDTAGEEIRNHLLQKALHTMQFFTVTDSSPSPRVSTMLSETFFESSRQNLITVASTRGIQTSSQVRLPNAVLLEFVKRLPVIPPAHIERASEFFDQIRSRSLLKDITLEDVFQELNARSLNVAEATSCLRWWINVSAHPGYDQRLRSRLLESAIIAVDRTEETNPGKATAVQPLSSVLHFLNPQRIPADVPLPPTCLAYEVSKSFTGPELSRVYGWSELSVPTWIEHLHSLSSEASCPPDLNIQHSPALAEKVFGVISRSWGNLSSRQQQETVTSLSSLSCVPTRKGMQRPSAAYFANVSLFEDLAIVEFPTLPVRGNLEKLLIALEVRRHVDLQLIFTRLVGGGDWSHVDLLTYLASNRDTLTSTEIDRLRKTPIWPMEGEKGTMNKEGKHKTVRHRANTLYEPVESLRSLGLPLLDWAGQGGAKTWRSNSEEAKFAFHLGLRRHPPLEEILRLASSSNSSTQTKALAYFLDKATYRENHDATIAREFSFVPCRLNTAGDEAATGRLKPTEVFTNPAAAVMHFPTVFDVDVTDIPKLGLRANPTSAMLVSRLVNQPPRSIQKAKQIFEYLASVQTSFSSHDLSILKQASFVPIESVRAEASDGPAALQLVAPQLCYFGGNETAKAFRSVFFYVSDMGSQANSFLRLVGVSDEPTIEEIASRLVSEPARFYNLCGSSEAYLSLLRQIATNWTRIRRPLRDTMRQSPFLLASKRLKDGNSSSATAVQQTQKSILDDDDNDDSDSEDAGMLVHSLKRPGEIVIADDANAGMIFGSSLFFAPHEDLLEQNLYLPLGSQSLSSLVEERYEVSSQRTSESKRAGEVRALILERTPLFLFETRQSGNKQEIRRDADWLKTALQVVEVGGDGLRLSRYLRFQGRQERDVQRASAMAQQNGRKLELFIASNMNLDWFEVAAALNKHMLSRQRLQEVLLFMTLLSTSLRDLKRRGFHVDKILQQRKAEKELIERQKIEEQRQLQLQALNRPSEQQVHAWQKQISAMFPDAEIGHIKELLRKQKENHVEEATNAMLTEGFPRTPHTKPSNTHLESSIEHSDSDGTGDPVVPGGFFSSFRSRFKRPTQVTSSLAAGTSSIQRNPPPAIGDAGAQDGGAPLPAAGIGSTGDKPAEQPSSLDSIRRNVLSAISASRPDDSTSVQSQQQQTQVKEAQSSYCDSTGVAANLSLAGEVAGMRVFLSPELDPASTLPENKQGLERLINLIYRPIGAIFGLDPRSMHVSQTDPAISSFSAAY